MLNTLDSASLTAICENAAKVGDIFILTNARICGVSMSAYTSRLAARAGQLGVLKWLDMYKYPISETSARAAAGKGHLHIVAWLISAGYAVGIATMIDAAACGQVDVVRFLREQHRVEWSSKVIEKAAVFGHANVVEYCANSGCCITRKAFEDAVHAGSLESIVAMHTARPELTPYYVFRHAAMHGHVKIVLWWINAGLKWNRQDSITLISQSRAMEKKTKIKLLTMIHEIIGDALALLSAVRIERSIDMLITASAVVDAEDDARLAQMID